MQKTWIDLLGSSTRNCLVDGRDIVRRTGPDRYVRLWTFASHAEALDAMHAWIGEVEGTGALTPTEKLGYDW